MFNKIIDILLIIIILNFCNILKASELPNQPIGNRNGVSTTEKTQESNSNFISYEGIRNKRQKISRPKAKPKGTGRKCKKEKKDKHAKKEARKPLKSIEDKLQEHVKGQIKKHIAKKSKQEGPNDNIEQIITKKMGSAVILNHYIKKMGIAYLIDQLVPTHKNRKITHGEMVVALLAYLLEGGRALYRLEKWAKETAVLDFLFPQYEPGDWTDDRIAGTLDALYESGLLEIQGTISANIVDNFNIDLNEIHYDTTSVSLQGTYYNSIGESAIKITFGHSKDKRPDLKQFVLGMGVSGDGGIPILSDVHNGNASDSKLPVPYWENLRKIANKSSFCFIGDSKIASKDNIINICSKNGKFLAPRAMSVKDQEYLLKRIEHNELHLELINLENKKDMRPIYEKLTDSIGNPYKAKGGENKEKEIYKVHEDSWKLKDEDKRIHDIRKFIIYSEQRAAVKAANREKRLNKAEIELNKLLKRLNKGKEELNTREKIEAAICEIIKKHNVKNLLKCEVIEQTQILRKRVGRGRPSANSEYIIETKECYNIRIQRDTNSLSKKAKLDGFFLMVSNLDSKEWSPESVISLYKCQYKVEHKFRMLKTPLAVTPMLLETPKRICSMMCIMTFALQLYTLIQRQAAVELNERNQPLAGLMPNKIKTWRPSTDFMVAAFDSFDVVIFTQGKNHSVHVTNLTPVQKEIIEILDVQPVKWDDSN